MAEKERLEAFEKMYKAIQAEQAETVAKMEQLKIAGKTKSATYRQLLGRKMMYVNMLDMYKLYDL